MNGVTAKAGFHATIWPQVVNVGLGIWLAVAGLVIEPHPAVLVWSDLISAALIVTLSLLSLDSRLWWARWGVGLVGVWLMTAPLVFWAPTAAAYGNNTLVGSLVVFFALVIPSIQSVRDSCGEIPPGWTYNPSAWSQRLGIVGFAILQFFIARTMTAFQLDHTQDIWDPVFGDGTRRVLDSDVSKSFPVSDAGLGAVTYLVEALTGCIGNTRRWRTMPWIVVLFGILIVPVGVVSIVLVVLQPVAVGAWCFWCLITAGLTVVMIGPAIDEVVATGQFLLHSRREGKSVWQTFWQGGEWKASAAESRKPHEYSLLRQFIGGLELLSIPWNIAICTVLGLWLMASPALLGSSGWVANNAHLTGALITTFAVIGFSEAGRGTRLVNLPIGAWLLVAPFVLAGGNSLATWNSIAIGIATMVLSLRRGRVEEQFGTWDRWVV